jgi:dTDP-4-amino-4,6-dideoxygalactose transaminase
MPPLEDIADDLNGALERGQLSNGGPNVRQFEHMLEQYLGTHCVCVSSGTAGLYLVSLCVNNTATFLLPAYTFAATALAFAMDRRQLIIGDIARESLTLSIDPSLNVQLTEVDTIVPVNVYGNPPDIEHIERVATAHGQAVVYDSAHGLGSTYGRRKVGTFGLAEVFSLHATKILGCGEGGFVSTTDAALAREIRARRNFGFAGNTSVLFGCNAKMQEFSAILGRWALPRLEQWITQRNELAITYRNTLKDLPGIRFQHIADGHYSNNVNFPIFIDEDFGLTRDELIQALAADNIIARAYFCPDLTGHASLSQRIKLLAGKPAPNASEASQKVVCLPIYSHQTKAEVGRICDCIYNIHHYRKDIKHMISSGKTGLKAENYSQPAASPLNEGG